MARRLSLLLLSILLASATGVAAEPVVVPAGEIRSGDVVALVAGPPDLTAAQRHGPSGHDRAVDAHQRGDGGGDAGP